MVEFKGIMLTAAKKESYRTYGSIVNTITSWSSWSPWTFELSSSLDHRFRTCCGICYGHKEERRTSQRIKKGEMILDLQIILCIIRIVEYHG